jgi:hypothetical protein
VQIPLSIEEKIGAASALGISYHLAAPWEEPLHTLHDLLIIGFLVHNWEERNVVINFSCDSEVGPKDTLFDRECLFTATTTRDDMKKVRTEKSK